MHVNHKYKADWICTNRTHLCNQYPDQDIGHQKALCPELSQSKAPTPQSQTPSWPLRQHSQFLTELLPLHILRVPQKIIQCQIMVYWTEPLTIIKTITHIVNRIDFVQAKECIVDFYGWIRHWCKMPRTLWRKKLYKLKD